MSLAVRHLLRLAGAFGAFGLRTGRWWFPVVVILLAIGAVLALTVQVALPTATYVMF